MNLLNIYVISLKSKEEYRNESNYLTLKTITNKIKLSKGIILNKEQEKQYSLYARSPIAITLAHLKVWKYIKKYKSNKNNESKIKNFSIILEDDALLNIKLHKFNKEIKYICENKEFDIYKLHSDFSNGFTSMAAYIINHKSIDKLLNLHKILIGHLDFDLYILHLFFKIVIITHETNIFKTDETDSTNRLDKYSSLNLLSTIHLGHRCDKNLKQLLTFKVFRIFNYETIVFEIILFSLLIISLIFRSKYLLLIVCILFIL